uniref:Uncharacterized protein n=1 Tax=Megaselia scalaris TaxID=36166 RepID=T1H0C3_MEGSC
MAHPFHQDMLVDGSNMLSPCHPEIGTKATAAGLGINDGNIVLGGFEFPQSNIDGDTTFTFSLQFVQNPGVFERSFAHFLSFLLEFLDGTLVNTSAFVDQMSGGGRFTRIDVSNDDDVNMNLFLTHGLF